jgi:hypothetical protein
MKLESDSRISPATRRRKQKLQNAATIAHTVKIVARVLRRGTERKIEGLLGEDQSGLRGGRGTRDAIGMLRIMSERTLDIDEVLCAWLIDWQNSFTM